MWIEALQTSRGLLSIAAQKLHCDVDTVANYCKQTQQIHEMALTQGIVPQALALVTAKVRDHFGDGTPSPAAVEQFLAALPPWDKIGMDQATFLVMPAPWRMDQARHFQTSPERRRPVMRDLTPEELASIEGLPRAERVERARQMQQTPAPAP